MPSLRDATQPEAVMEGIALRSALALVGARLEVSRGPWRPELVAALLTGQDWPLTAEQVRTAAQSLGMDPELEEVLQALEAARERGEVRAVGTTGPLPAWRLLRKPSALT